MSFSLWIATYYKTRHVFNKHICTSLKKMFYTDIENTKILFNKDVFAALREMN